MSIKEQLYHQCNLFLNGRLEVIQRTISDVQNSFESETKSSAGDKHETGRAMLQLEREKAGQQLAMIQTQQELLQKISYTSEHKIVALGSIIFTTDKNYYMSISAGEIKIGEDSFYAISAVTPIGKLLLSKSKGDTINFMQQKFSITKVL